MRERHVVIMQQAIERGVEEKFPAAHIIDAVGHLYHIMGREQRETFEFNRWYAETLEERIFPVQAAVVTSENEGYEEMPELMFPEAE